MSLSLLGGPVSLFLIALMGNCHNYFFKEYEKQSVSGDFGGGWGQGSPGYSATGPMGPGSGLHHQHNLATCYISLFFFF